MPIETIIALGTACVRALELAARLERASRDVKDKCQELAERVKILLAILPRGVVGVVLAAVSDFNGQDLDRLEAAEEKINTCIGDLGLAVGAPAAPVVARPQQRTTARTTTAIQNTTNIFFGDVYVGRQAAASSSSSSSRRTHPQMQLQQLGSRSPGPVVSGVPSSSNQRRLTAPTTTRTTHAAAISSALASSSRSRPAEHGGASCRPTDHRGAPGPATTKTVAAAIAAAFASSRSRPTDHRGAPGPATRTTHAPPPPVPPSVRRSSSTSSSRARPPTEPRGAPRGLGGGGLPQQRAAATTRPAHATTVVPRHPAR
ncbi:hypothetical protein BRADI_4g10663v3 [Brachypodium distachyon]|uniref:Uncharacterized protein n=1 Tax=Brachypodium distachyon TaxID=15368 RepID=A0A0Q3L450_BRADI|nr:hypothetical protein BRADI_4g10663v3 [Brachypodium distachyon]